jgi:hypothetical protein
MGALGERMFTHLVLLIRDSAHALRIAMKEPLHHDTLFGKVWEELFNKAKAVVPNFQYSDKLKALLVAAQGEGAKPLGLPSNLQPLAVVLECFSFAKQRFDSTVDPCAKLALMLLPVTTILAISASDTRSKPEVRKRARRGLEFMTTKNVTALGLSADWGIVWEAFLRLFDKGDHDIAGSSEEIEGLIEALEKLFVHGGVLQDTLWKEPVANQPAIGGKVLPPTISHNMQEAGVDGQFITTIVGKQLHRKCVFNVGGDPVLLWGDLAASDKAELASRIQNVAKVSIGRLRAEFPTSEMRFFLRAVHMPLVRAAFGPRGPKSKQEALTGCCKAALNSMGCPESDQATALLEYEELAMLFARLAQPGQLLATKSNREIWGHCLDESFLGHHFPGRPFLQIPDLIRFYHSIEDGSCNVERGLGGVRAFIKEFQSTDIDAVDDLTVLKGGQLQPADLAVEEHGFWEAGPFGLECGVLWREVLGARMGIYGNRSHEKKVKTGTYKHVKAGVLKAIGAVTTSRNRQGQPLAAGQAPSLATALGRPAPSSKAGTPGCPHWHAGFY